MTWTNTRVNNNVRAWLLLKSTFWLSLGNPLGSLTTRLLGEMAKPGISGFMWRHRLWEIILKTGGFITFFWFGVETIYIAHISWFYSKMPNQQLLIHNMKVSIVVKPPTLLSQIFNEPISLHPVTNEKIKVLFYFCPQDLSWNKMWAFWCGSSSIHWEPYEHCGSAAYHCTVGLTGSGMALLNRLYAQTPGPTLHPGYSEVPVISFSDLLAPKL